MEARDVAPQYMPADEIAGYRENATSSAKILRLRHGENENVR